MSFLHMAAETVLPLQDTTCCWIKETNNLTVENDAELDKKERIDNKNECSSLDFNNVQTNDTKIGTTEVVKQMRFFKSFQ